MDKSELIITALKQRIGDLVSNYETQIAIIRADLTHLIAENEQKEKTVMAHTDAPKEQK
jgi:hypothetical protein